MSAFPHPLRHKNALPKNADPPSFLVVSKIDSNKKTSPLLMTATSLRLRLHWLHSQGHFLTTWSSSGLTVGPLSGHPIQLRFKTMQIIINQGKNAHLTCSSCSHSLLYLVEFLFWWKNMEEPMEQGKHEVTGPPLGPITWGYFWYFRKLWFSEFSSLHSLKAAAHETHGPIFL